MALTKAEKDKRYYERHKEKILEKQKLYNARNAEHRKEVKKAYRQANQDKFNQWSREWRARNPGVKRVRDPKKRRAETMLRRARIRMAFPKWADLDKIKEIYINCPSGFHVDHIIPLKGKYVCGLHVETNLQYLPAIENMRKSNSFTGVNY